MTNAQKTGCKVMAKYQAITVFPDPVAPPITRLEDWAATHA